MNFKIDNLFVLRINAFSYTVILEKEMQLTPVFSPGKTHGQRRPAGYSPWGHKEVEATVTEHTLSLLFSQRH